MADNEKKGLFGLVKATLSNLSQRATADRFETQLDQLIHQTQEHIREEEEAINTAHAAELVAQARIDEITPQVSELEELALTAIRGRRTAKAKELVATLEPMMATLQAHQSNLDLALHQIAQRKILIEAYEGQIRRFRHQLGLRRASENLQRSQEAIHRFGDAGAVYNSSQSEVDASPSETAEEIFQRLSAQAKKQPSPQARSNSKADTKKTASKKTPARKTAAKKTGSTPRKTTKSNQAKE